MTYRRAIALASLVSAFVALYLHLWKLGLMGTLSCSAGGGGGCAFVQGSRYGWFLGVDVALIGTVGYTLLFAVALVATLPRFEDSLGGTAAIAALVLPALALTIRLKWAEFIVLRAFCPWCAVSTVTIVLCTVLVALDWRRVRALRGDPEAAGLPSGELTRA